MMTQTIKKDLSGLVNFTSQSYPSIQFACLGYTDLKKAMALGQPRTTTFRKETSTHCFIIWFGLAQLLI